MKDKIKCTFEKDLLKAENTGKKANEISGALLICTIFKYFDIETIYESLKEFNGETISELRDYLAEQFYREW